MLLLHQAELLGTQQTGMLVRNDSQFVVVHRHDGDLQHIHPRRTWQQLVGLGGHQQRAVEMAKRRDETLQRCGTATTQNGLRNHVVHDDDALDQWFAIGTTLHLIAFQLLEVIQKLLLIPFIQHQNLLLMNLVPRIIRVQNARLNNGFVPLILVPRVHHRLNQGGFARSNDAQSQHRKGRLGKQRLVGKLLKLRVFPAVFAGDHFSTQTHLT